MKHINSKPKTNDGFFVTFVSLFTTVLLLTQLVSSWLLTQHFYMVLFFMMYISMEIFDKSRSLRILKASIISLIIFYISSLSTPYLQMGTIFNTHTYNALYVIIGFSIAYYINVKLYFFLKYKINKKLIFLRVLITNLISNFILLISLNIHEITMINLLEKTIYLLPAQLAGIPILYILLWMFKGYKFTKNKPYNNYSNKHKGFSNEKYNASNVKDSTNAKRYGKGSRRN